LAVALLVRHWVRTDRRRGPPGGDGPGEGGDRLDPELEKRLDDELARLDA
jgi:hypothetical protein